MTKQTHTIERLILPVGDSDLRDLARLLVDAVESGAAVSFLAPLTLERAEDWWRKTTSASYSGAIFLVARDAEGIVGTVQLHPAWAPNQPHRGDCEVASRSQEPPRGPWHSTDADHRGRGAARRIQPPDAGREARRSGGAFVSAHRMDPRGDDPTVCPRSGRNPA